MWCSRLLNKLDSLRRTLVFASAIVLWISTGALGATASSQDLSGVDSLFDADSGLAAELPSHPEFLDSQPFLALHPAAAQYFTAHPQLKSKLKSNPKLLIERERRFRAAEVGKIDANGKFVTRAAIDWFDGFLDANSTVATLLHQQPNLIDSPDLLASNPALAEFLTRNPGFAERAKQHPGAYLNHPAQQ